MAEIKERFILAETLKKTDAFELRKAVERQSGESVILWLGKSVPLWPQESEGIAGLPAVLEAGMSAEGGAFLVTEPLEGMWLDEIAKDGVVPHELAFSIVGQLADLLAALHTSCPELTVDLSPRHIFVREDGAVKAFGLERIREAGIHPDRLQGELKAWGQLAYRLFSGEAWSSGSSLLELCPDLDPRLVRLVESCAAASAETRPQNGKELVEQFRRATQGITVGPEPDEQSPAPQITTNEPVLFSEPSRKGIAWKAAAAVLVAGVLCALGFGGYWSVSYTHLTLPTN